MLHEKYVVRYVVDVRAFSEVATGLNSEIVEEKRGDAAAAAHRETHTLS